MADRTGAAGRVAALCALCACCLLLAASRPSRAGPSLDAAIERDGQVAAGRAHGDLAETAPPAGITLAGEASRNGLAPQFVAGPFNARGGLRLQSGTFDVGSRGQLRLGLSWREGPGRKPGFEGSSFVWPLERGGPNAAYASVQRRHWGPGWAGSLILDGAAPAIPALGWRRTPVQSSPGRRLSMIGPWGADLFVGRLQGHRNAARPQVIGMRFVFAPIEELELGLARVLQWGGRGRDESSSSLIDALLGNDNVGFGGITADNEPGNQLAGLDFRWLVDRAHETSVYGQMVGEDEAGLFPSRNMVLVGVDTRLGGAQGRLRLFFEWVDTLAGRVSRDPRPFVAYRHSSFERGYTQEGTVLGHPLGGDVRAGSLGLLHSDAGLAAQVTLTIGQAEPTAHYFAPGRVLGLGLAAQADLQSAWRIGVNAAFWHDRAGRRGSAQAWLLRRF